VIAAFRVFRRALRDGWDALVLLAVLNFLWAALSVTIVLLPSAAAALFEATHSLARGEAPGVAEFLAGARRHFVRAWAWALVNLAAWTILLVNILFYRTRPEPWAPPLQVLFLFFAGFWLIAQFYVWPFLFEQSEMSLRQAFRNAVLMVLAAPVFSLTLGILAAVVVALSIVLIVPPLLITASFLCLLSSHAVLDRLRAFRKLPSPAGATD
jgi:uncharacterized membrane protein YesL